MNLSKNLYNALAIFAIATVLFLPALIFNLQQKESKEILYLNEKTEQERLQFEAIQNAYRLMTKNIYDNLINNDHIVSLIKKANYIDDPEVASDSRERLYGELLPLFDNLEKNSIEHLHFHLQGSISFLRFHQPEKFGDSLIGTRYSIDKINRTNERVYGFEEGGSYNGFRDIFPILHKTRHIGSVEIAYSFEALKKEAMKLRPGYYAFLLKRSALEAKSPEEELSHFMPSSLSQTYVQNVHSFDTAHSEAFPPDLIDRINANIVAEASQKLQKEESFLLQSKIDENYYLICFTPVNNIESKQVAYLISYHKDHALGDIHGSYILRLIMAALASFLIATLGILFYRSKKETSKKLEILSTTDALTKIANKNKLDLVLEASMQTALRYELPLSLIIFDVDRFKETNEKLGHDTGDEILVELAALVTQQIRLSDLFARWEGEKFILVLTETNHQQAKVLAEKLRSLIKEHTFVVTAKITCSFGVTQLHKDDNRESLFKRLEKALHMAKERGRNQVTEFN